MIGILGASGAVGRAAVRELRHAADTQLRTASRTSGVDAHDPRALHHFCRGCDVVIDCTGPSSPQLVQSIASAAFASGAAYVTAAGGDAVRDAVLRVHAEHPRSTALVAAGMMPGLTALLPRALAPAARITAYAGGRGIFTRTAAIDFRDAALTAMPALHDVELPFFPGRVTAIPHVSREGERVARLMRLDDARWHTVFDGAHTIAALRDPDRIERASALDLFGRESYQRIVVIADDARTLVLQARDASELTAAFASVAALLAGGVEAGVHYAGEVLDPMRAIERLRASLAVASIDSPELHAFEEGVL